jgi:hypothetical protein
MYLFRKSMWIFQETPEVSGFSLSLPLRLDRDVQPKQYPILHRLG